MADQADVETGTSAAFSSRELDEDLTENTHNITETNS